MSEHGAAQAIYEGVVAAVAHGEPVREEEDEVDVFVVVYVWPPHADNEVEVVGQPAEGEDEDHHHQHPDDFPPVEEMFLVPRHVRLARGRA